MGTRSEMLADIFITAMEGGIGYWAYALKYHWALDEKDELGLHKVDPEFFAILTDAEYAHKADKTDADFHNLRLNKEVIETGIARLIKPGFQVREDIKDKVIIADRRDGQDIDLDANDADCIVQAGLFNEIRFG